MTRIFGALKRIKILIIGIVLAAYCFSGVAQEVRLPSDSSHVLEEIAPEYPGGMTAMLEFIEHNIVYPKAALKEGIEGKVMISFVVYPDGSIRDVITLNGADPLLNQEAERVVASMPDWTPGTQDGKAVKVQYSLPITFKAGWRMHIGKLNFFGK